MMRRACLTRRPTTCRGFTLAELLAVIVIMSLLMVVVVPGISGLTRGASLRGATMQVRTTLIAARQTAISRRADVSVMFPSALPGNNSKNFRAIAVYASNYTGSWYVANWEFLPPGVVFSPNNFASSDKVTAPIEGSTTATVPAITFNRLGERTGTSASAAQVLLLEGFVNGGTVVSRSKAGGTNQIDVLYPAGIIQVKRL